MEEFITQPHPASAGPTLLNPPLTTISSIDKRKVTPDRLTSKKKWDLDLHSSVTLPWKLPAAPQIISKPNIEDSLTSRFVHTIKPVSGHALSFRFSNDVGLERIKHPQQDKVANASLNLGRPLKPPLSDNLRTSQGKKCLPNLPEPPEKDMLLLQSPDPRNSFKEGAKADPWYTQGPSPKIQNSKTADELLLLNTPMKVFHEFVKDEKSMPKQMKAFEKEVIPDERPQMEKGFYPRPLVKRRKTSTVVHC